MFFRLALYSIEMKIDIKKQFFTTLSDINISFFCINKERKVQETIKDPLKEKREPFKENQEPLKNPQNLLIKDFKNHLKKIKNPLKKFPKTFQ